MVKNKFTTNLEETLNKYVEFLDMTAGELLVAIPDSDIVLYSHQELKSAFEKADKRGVKVRILSNQRTRIDLPGNQYEVGRVLVDHYAVSDRKRVFMGKVGNPEQGVFVYESFTILPEHMSKFETMPILSAIS